jgi:hypothetical protein
VGRERGRLRLGRGSDDWDGVKGAGCRTPEHVAGTPLAMNRCSSKATTSRRRISIPWSCQAWVEDRPDDAIRAGEAMVERSKSRIVEKAPSSAHATNTAESAHAAAAEPRLQRPAPQNGTSTVERAPPEFRTPSATATISTTYGRPTFTSSLCLFAALPNMRLPPYSLGPPQGARGSTVQAVSSHGDIGFG